MFWGNKKRLNKLTLVITVTLLMVVLAFSGCVENNGGESLKIVVVGRDSASGTREFFHENVMDEEDFVATMLEKNSNGAVHQTVSQTEGAIGFVGLGYLDDEIKALKINGVTPSVSTVSSGDYPIARNLNMYTDGEPSGIILEFLNYLDSTEGQAIVADEGFVPKDNTEAYTATEGLSGTIEIEGSTTVLPIAQAAAEEFMTLQTDIDVTVNGGGSSVGIQSVGEGTADIGMASRGIKPSEQSNYPTLKEHIVCADGIAIVVHPSNDYFEALTVGMVKAIYKGVFTDWNEVPSSETIVVVGRDSASGTREFFHENVMDEEDFVATMLEKNSNGAVHQTVSQTEGAIGFVGLGYLDDEIKALKINGVTPSVSTVSSGDYPIARNLNMYTDGEPSGIILEFLNYLDSTEGQAIVADEGFVPKDNTEAYTATEGLSGTIEIEGSTTVLPIAQAAAEEFMTLQTDIDVTVNGGGSSVGIQSVGEGTADIGMASRGIKPSEQSNYPTLKEHIVCADGIAIVVHPSNYWAKDLTVSQVKSIYKGTFADWNEIFG